MHARARACVCVCVCVRMCVVISLLMHNNYDVTSLYDRKGLMCNGAGSAMSGGAAGCLVVQQGVWWCSRLMHAA